MLRVVADSNIYISGLHFGGNPDKFLDMARAGEIRLILSDHIVAEVTKVLREKFGWTQDALARMREGLADFTEKVVPQQTVDVIKVDPSDNRILECAASAASDYIVTGDKHLLKLRRYDSIQIMKLADFFEVLRGAASGR